MRFTEFVRDYLAQNPRLNLTFHQAMRDERVKCAFHEEKVRRCREGIQDPPEPPRQQRRRNRNEGDVIINVNCPGAGQQNQGGQQRGIGPRAAQPPAPPGGFPPGGPPPPPGPGGPGGPPAPGPGGPPGGQRGVGPRRQQVQPADDDGILDIQDVVRPPGPEIDLRDDEDPLLIQDAEQLLAIEDDPALDPARGDREPQPYGFVNEDVPVVPGPDIRRPDDMRVPVVPALPPGEEPVNYGPLRSLEDVDNILNRNVVPRIAPARPTLTRQTNMVTSDTQTDEPPYTYDLQTQTDPVVQPPALPEGVRAEDIERGRAGREYLEAAYGHLDGISEGPFVQQGDFRPIEENFMRIQQDQRYEINAARENIVELQDRIQRRDENIEALNRRIQRRSARYANNLSVLEEQFDRRIASAENDQMGGEEREQVLRDLTQSLNREREEYAAQIRDITQELAEEREADALLAREYQERYRRADADFQRRRHNDLHQLQMIRQEMIGANEQRARELQQEREAHEERMRGDMATINVYADALRDQIGNAMQTRNMLQDHLGLNQFIGSYRPPRVYRDDSGALRYDAGGFENFEVAPSTRFEELPYGTPAIGVQTDAPAVSGMETQTDAPTVSGMETQTDEVRPPSPILRERRRGRDGDFIDEDDERFSREVRQRTREDALYGRQYRSIEGDDYPDDYNIEQVYDNDEQIPVVYPGNQQRTDPDLPAVYPNEPIVGPFTAQQEEEPQTGRVPAMVAEIERNRGTTAEEVLQRAQDLQFRQGTDRLRTAEGQEELLQVVRRLPGTFTSQQVRNLNRQLQPVGVRVVRPRGVWGIVGAGLKTKKLNNQLKK